MAQNIVIVIESLGGGGAQHVASSLMNHLAEKGWSVSVVTFLDKNDDKFALNPKIERYVVHGTGESANALAALGANIRRLIRLRGVLKTINADAVISFVGTTNILTVLASAGLKSKVVISERNDPGRQSLGRIWDILRRLTYGFAGSVTSNSEAALHTMRSYVPAEKLCWIPNSIRVAPKGSRSFSVERPFILSVGRLNDQKNFEMLFEAFSAFRERFPDWHLIVLGEGPKRHELDSKIIALSLENHVAMPGYENPFPYYDAAAIFVLSSRYEGMPNVVLEAMNSGLPVIVTASQAALKSFIFPGESGFFVAPDNADDMAEKMIALAKSARLRKKVGKKGQDIVREKCNEDVIFKKWMEIIDPNSGS